MNRIGCICLFNWIGNILWSRFIIGMVCYYSTEERRNRSNIKENKLLFLYPPPYQTLADDIYRRNQAQYQYIVRLNLLHRMAIEIYKNTIHRKGT